MIQTNTLLDVRAKVESAFPFTVDKYRLYGPEGLRTDHFGLFRSDTCETVGPAVKEGYEPHTVDDVAALAEAAWIGMGGDHGSEVVLDAAWTRSGHNVVIGPSREQRRSIFGTRDNIFPRISIDARFGGAFVAECGMYRDACSNLMMIRQVRGTSVRIRHTESLRDRIDDLVVTFRNLQGGFDQVFETAAKLEAMRVDVKDFIGELYPVNPNATERSVKRTSKMVEQMLMRMYRERVSTGRELGTLQAASLWECVNAVTGYVQHDKSRKGNLSSQQRALLAVNDVQTRNAFDLALSMAG